MNKCRKQLTNPFSAGGGGINFETRVQASFVALMLTGGFVPCMPCWPINKIKLQGKYLGYDTDDLIIYVKEVSSNKEAKLIGQIKHSIKITNNKEFKTIIQAAWNDFNNPNVFSEGKDIIALICGPLSATDTDNVRTLLRQADHADDDSDFINRVSYGKFTGGGQRKKLDVFKTTLRSANNNIDLTNDQLWRFLKSFRLLIYDLDIKGVILSLLHSLIGQYSQVNADTLWTQLKDIVEWKNENASTITLKSIPEDIRSAFTRQIIEVMPPSLTKTPSRVGEVDWNRAQYASELAKANLLGSWNEKFDADKNIVGQIAKEDFATWIPKMREIIQQPDSPIALKNGIWTVTERQKLWQALGSRLFDDHLDMFKKCVVAVLTERDPKFDLDHEERYAASIHGKVMGYSHVLRKGLAETLALLGSRPKDLTNCSLNKPETTSSLAIREIFNNADWVLWGSLDNLLPLLAEASPGEFICAIEANLQKTPCPFDILFLQEGNGITGGNYLTGLLWALETLAWDEQYLVSATILLGELASHDPGGTWTNRPSNSLTIIFLPWLPQTTASIEKRKVAVKALCDQESEVAWKLLLSLLPNQHQTSLGSHKPLWRGTIPDNWTKTVSTKDYWDQACFYADIAVKMAKTDVNKLCDLIRHLNNLPKPPLDNVLEYLSTAEVKAKPDEKKTILWTALVDFVSRHKRYADAKWAMDSGIIKKIENIAESLAPINPLNRYQRLFSERDIDLLADNGDWQEQQNKIEEIRRNAVNEIFDSLGIDSLVQFAEKVNSPWKVGFSLGFIADERADSFVIPSLLDIENKKLVQFASGFVWGRYRKKSWAWFDNINFTDWSNTQKGQLLSFMPFTNDTWQRTDKLLGTNDMEYWIKVNVNPYQADGNLYYAIDKLIKYNRPNDAINCLYHILHDKKTVDHNRVVKALLAVPKLLEQQQSMDVHYTIELIKTLQDSADISPDDLFLVEWAYLPILDKHQGASPKILEQRLVNNPDFFCEVIRAIYRSRKEPKAKKEPTEQQKSIASNAYCLLDKWRMPPGFQADGSFSSDSFKQWLVSVKGQCSESGHLEVALQHIGGVLIYCPPDSGGLWINHTVAEALNGKDVEEMRKGFYLGVLNSRGVHRVDPTGKPEREFAVKYRNQANEVEDAGYQRFAATLRSLADSYEGEAERIIEEYEAQED